MEENKGDILNQLAIITDLIEKVNFTFKTASIVFDVNKKEFNNIYNYTSRKTEDEFRPLKDDDKNFSINISDVQIIINKSNV